MAKSATPLDTYVGQSSAKQVVEPAISDYVKFGTPIPTYLIDWPPGHGKNTLHHAIASTMGVKAPRFTSSDGIKSLGQLLHRYCAVDCLLLIDEAHVIKQRKLVEPLLTLLEDRTFVHPNGVEGKYPKMSFMLATSQGWAIPEDIQSRLTASLPLDPYSDADILQILRMNIGSDFTVEDSILTDLISLALNEPRTARNIAQRVNARLRLGSQLDRASIARDLALTIDGLEDKDIRIYEFIAGNYRNGPGSASSSDIARFVRVPGIAVSRVMGRLVRLGLVFQDERYIWNIQPSN